LHFAQKVIHKSTVERFWKRFTNDYKKAAAHFYTQNMNILLQGYGLFVLSVKKPL